MQTEDPFATYLIFRSIGRRKKHSLNGINIIRVIVQTTQFVIREFRGVSINKYKQQCEKPDLPRKGIRYKEDRSVE